ncbi:MAG: CerR family C-terminal domain-containing protein [Planctomycetota bacterium]|jgi:AcrR family transcriptional regulator
MANQRPPTHDALLDAAEQLFSEKGYAAVGIREIAERAGANIAAIKYHFGSKSDLYRETVQRAMARREAVGVWDLFRQKPGDPRSAASVLVRFIQLYLTHLLPADGDDSSGNLILREALEPTEAIEAVVGNYMQPHQAMLIEVLGTLVPGSTHDELLCIAHSILAQILHYRVFRPFVERLGLNELDQPRRVAQIADHIARFSLRALGCSDQLIEDAIKAASAAEPATRESRMLNMKGGRT